MEHISQTIPKVSTLQPKTISELVERVVIEGDLSKLNAEQRVAYYKQVCDSIGLNPLTKPFDYIELPSPQGGKKLTLYAKKDATDQLRKLHEISVTITSKERVGDVYIVTARAKMAGGREDESTGAVPLTKENGRWEESQYGKKFFKPDGTFTALSPESQANAMMKAETKAKRRVTLSIAGLGFLDESEVGDIRGAKPVVDQVTGEVKELPTYSDKISDAQRRRLFAIATKNKWPEEEIKELVLVYGYESTRDILKKDYEEICREIEENPKEAEDAEIKDPFATSE